MKNTRLETASLNRSLAEILAIAEHAQVERADVLLAEQKAKELKELQLAGLKRLRASQEADAMQSVIRENQILERMAQARHQGQVQGLHLTKKREILAETLALEQSDKFALEADVLLIKQNLSRKRWGKGLGVIGFMGFVLVVVLSSVAYNDETKKSARDLAWSSEINSVASNRDARISQLSVEQANAHVLSELEVIALDSELAQAKADVQLAEKALNERFAATAKANARRKLAASTRIRHGAGSVLPQHTKAVETSAIRTVAVPSFECLPGDPMCMSF